MMMKLVRPLLILLLLSTGRLIAQPASQSPLTSARASEQVVPGRWIMAENRADQALQSGFPATAATIYGEILADKNVPEEMKQRVTLARVTALMDAGDLAAAETGLQSYDGPRGSAYQLRAGLLAINAHKVAPARSALAAGKVEELPEPDRGWWYFLQASIADEEGQIVQANAIYEQAMRAAVSDLQRARFVLGQEQSRLRTEQVSETQLATLRANMDRFQGQRTGYAYVRTYAAALAGLGRSVEAQEILQRQLATLPVTERDAADQLGLMLGLIAGEDSVAGRQAFRQLLRDAQRPDTKRLALQLLVRGAKNQADREQLFRELGTALNTPTQQPIVEDLLLVRAQLALADKAYALAEKEARALLERYPASTHKTAALGVRLVVAWELKRYRTAADVIAQYRAALLPGRLRAELGVLLAEAFFRAEDYRNAADTYEAALHEAPLAAPIGVLIFQRVLSEIRADRLEAAAQQLDEAAKVSGFDAVNHWQAEWNLVRVMQVRGQEQAAQARVDKLLAAGVEEVPEELRVRMLWLRVKLSFDTDQPAAALRQADELLGTLSGVSQLATDLRNEVSSTTRLLKAQALLALGQDEAGFTVLDSLRTNFHASAAAEYSYLIQAGFLTQRGDLAGAQRVLINFVDTAEYRGSDFAPLALYQTALLLERQGLDRQLEEAYKLLERIVRDYPRDGLVFNARLKQGDLLRKLNNFPAARQVYEYLVNNYPGHPDELVAQLRLADSLFAQGANSVVNYESASAIFERLRDLPSAPVDLRAEAGFKWAYALAKRAQTARAQTVYWSVVEGFLLDAKQGVKLGATGRYWVSRSLLELGQIHEDAGRLDEAQRVYQLIVDNRLGGMAQAQAKLARYRPVGAVAP
jgi:cellulose synthase operon protein C